MAVNAPAAYIKASLVLPRRPIALCLRPTRRILFAPPFRARSLFNPKSAIQDPQ